MTELLKLKTDIESKISEFKAEVDKLTGDFEKTMIGLQKKGYKIDKDQIVNFMARFWYVYPTKNPFEWEVAIPVFIPFNIGWFDRTEGGYNIFVINKYTKWLGEEIPTFISTLISIPPVWNLKVEGDTLIFPENLQEKVESKYGRHLGLVEKDRATIKQGHEFDLIAEIIDSGSLPFVPKPVAHEDLRDSDFTQIWNELDEKYDKLEIFSGKYSYEGEGWKAFEKYGAIGIFWAMSFGKTVIGTYIFSRIKGEKALVVPTKTLEEQWTEFFTLNCPELLKEVRIYTYQGMSRQKWDDLRKSNFTVIGYDECHFLPADSFSKLATIKTKYRFGLSATPYREDGRTNYIMASTGIPVGLDWKTIMTVLGKEYHTINVHIVKDLEAKYQLVRQLYDAEKRTIIFVDLLEQGRRLSDTFEVPFISGETKNRLELIRESKSFVASRVMELGISIKDLERIIEFGFFKGSRREEVQKTGRLMHSIVKGKVHDILMTKEEIEKFGKRLYGLYEKGFRYKLIPHMAGIQPGTTEAREKKPSRSAKDTVILKEIYKEGYFQHERTIGDVTSEIEKHGGKVNSSVLYVYLLRMVRKGQLYKIKTEAGNVFKQR